MSATARLQNARNSFLSIVTNFASSCVASTMNSQSQAEQSLSRTNSSTACDSTSNSETASKFAASLCRARVWSKLSVYADSLVVEAYEQHDERADRTLQFTTVDFSGQLTVTDPLAFVAALGAGIGHAKAFGCGLLLIRRVS